MEKIIIKEKVDETVIERLKDTRVIREIRRNAGNGFTIWLPTDLICDDNGNIATAMEHFSENYLKIGRDDIVLEIDDDGKNPARTYFRALLATVRFAGTLEWARRAMKKIPVSVLLETSKIFSVPRTWKRAARILER